MFQSLIYCDIFKFIRRYSCIWKYLIMQLFGNLCIICFIIFISFIRYIMWQFIYQLLSVCSYNWNIGFSENQNFDFCINFSVCWYLYFIAAADLELIYGIYCNIMYQWLSTSHEGYVMTDTPMFDITANPLSITQQHTITQKLHLTPHNKTTQHNTTRYITYSPYTGTLLLHTWYLFTHRMLFSALGILYRHWNVCLN